MPPGSVETKTIDVSLSEECPDLQRRGRAVWFLFLRTESQPNRISQIGHNFSTSPMFVCLFVLIKLLF